MAKLNDTDGFHIYGWMVNELHLEGADLLAFAIVHTFTQSDAGIYKGNTQYLSAWTGWTEKTSRIHLARLVELGLIQPVRGREENTPYCYYKLDPDFYKKHPVKFTGSPGKNYPTHPVKITESTRKKLPGEYNNIEKKKGNNNIYSDSAFLHDLISIGVTEETATAWMVVRHKAKAVSTRLAFDGIAREIAAAVQDGHTADECIRTAVERSWRGFKAEWLRKDTPQPRTPSPGRPKNETLSEMYARIARELREEQTPQPYGTSIDEQ